MDLGLRDRVVFVGGSSRGIGKAIAKEFAAEGSRVVITGRDHVALAAAEHEMSTLAPERVLAICGDLAVPGELERGRRLVEERWAAPDVVVANVGTGRGRTGWDLADPDWDALLEINLRTSVRIATAFIPGMINRGSGSIVFIGSITGLESTPAPVHYSAAKAALTSYAMNLARLMGGNGVRVNIVAPGNIMFAGGTWERRTTEDPTGVARMLEADVPLRRFGTVEEVSGVVAFVASRRAGFLTGACVVVDGGQTRSY